MSDDSPALAGTVSPLGVLHRPDGTRTFLPGHRASTKHGAYSKLAMTPRAAELADELRELVPAYDPADEPALQAFAMVVVQARAAAAALEAAADEGNRADLPRLSKDARGWATSALRYADAFGMTPRSRVALGLDLVRGQRESLTLTRLAELSDQDKDKGAA